MPHAGRLASGRDDLLDDLRTLGVRRGDALFVHAGIETTGFMIGGARTAIEALVDAVGPSGLVVMPAFSSDALMPAMSGDTARGALERAVPGFDPERSAADRAGLLAEAFRRWPGVHRSTHPVFSLAAHGAGAEELLSPHPRDWALGPVGPMGRLMEHDAGKVLTWGAPWADHPALTMAETMATSRRLRVVRYKDTGRQPVRWLHLRDIAPDNAGLFASLGAAFETAARNGIAGPLARGRIGLAPASLCRLDDLLNFAAPRLSCLNAADRPDGCLCLDTGLRGDAATASTVTLLDRSGEREESL